MITYSKPNKTQLFFFELARQEAKKSTVKKSKHGAVLVQGSKVLFTGYNYDFGHKIMHGRYSLHAEANVILQARHAGYKTLKGMSLYVVRVGYDNKLWCSKPCTNCRNLIGKCNVNQTFYSER